MSRISSFTGLYFGLSKIFINYFFYFCQHPLLKSSDFCCTFLINFHPFIIWFCFSIQHYFLQLEKCKKDKVLIGRKYKHQNSNTATSTHAGLFALNNPSIGAIRQDIKNTPCIISRCFNHRSAFVIGVIVSPAKNVATDMAAYPNRS